jgi:predicted ArsR family transcriptional regulator
MTTTGIPTTGRIGRFAKIIEKELGTEILLKVMKDSDRYTSFKAPEQAQWWSAAIERLSNEVGIEYATHIMHLCGQRCCGKGIRRTAKKLRSESQSIEDFLTRASTHGLKEGEVEYVLQDNNTIIGIFHRCFCGQVAQTKTHFINMTYCQCSAEFHKQYFQAALDIPVDVKITQSIINGANTCRFIVQMKP